MFRPLALLLFFPSITFGLISAEVFPWGIIFAAVYMRYCAQPMLALLGLLCVSSCFALLMSFVSDGTSETDVIRSLAAYVNVILVSQTLLLLGRERALELSLLSRKVFWGLIALGVIQTFGSDLLGNVIHLLVPRGQGGALVESSRGVTLLATEPARAGIDLTLIYLIYRLTLGRNKARGILTDVFVILFQALVIQSASSLAFSLGAFAIIYFRMRTNILALVGTLISAAVLVFFVTSVLPTMGGRAGNLVLSLGDLEGLGEIVFYLAVESGNRLLALYSFFLSGFHHPFGFGVGSWPHSSMTAVLESGLNYRDFRFFDVVGNGNLIPFRGPGVISNLLLDMGILGTTLVIFFFRKSILQYNKFNDLSLKAFLIFIFKISLFGSPGNPIVFVFFITVFLMPSSKKMKLPSKPRIGFY